MAREFIEGFESGDLALWDFNNLCLVVASQTGMSGSYCAFIDQFNHQLYKDITSRDEYYFAFLFRYTQMQSDSNGCNLIAFYKSDGTILGRLALNYSTRVLSARSNANAVLASGPALSYSQTYLIEVRFKPNTSGGVWQVKIDGAALCIDFTGNTGVTGQIGRFALGGFVSYGPISAWFDNFVVDTAAWIGSTQIVKIVPNAAGATTQWTPSAGDNYTCVDETPPSDADYVSINAVDQIDAYAHAALPEAVNTIKCIQHHIRMVKEGAATPQNIKPFVSIGGTPYPGSDIPVSLLFRVKTVLQEVSPATGVAWTVAEVNSAQFGIKSAA